MKGVSVKFLLISAALLLTATAPCAYAHHGSHGANQLGQFSPSAASKELTIRQIAPIEFGMFTSGKGGGNVTIDPKTGMRTTGGDISTLNGNYGRAEFEIHGAPAQEVVLNFQSSVNLANKTNNGSLSLTKFTTYPSLIKLDQHGRARVGVGATLRTVAGAGRGQYSGNFTVDARYLR